jgi:hypothetical protein
MDPKFDFERKITISLHRDEAIVLLVYLSRELWRHGESRLSPTFEDPAEPHCLRALLQELIPPLGDTGDPKDADAIIAAAQAHLLARHQ